MKSAHHLRFSLLGGMALIGTVMLLPFVWQVLTSLKPFQGIEAQFWPSRFEFGNYIEVFRQIPFARYFLNSIAITLCITLLQTFSSALAAYAFSQLRWKGRDGLFLIYLGTLMVPQTVVMIPCFWLLLKLGLYNNYAGLILPWTFTAFGTFLLRQFMLGIPRSLKEAAVMDGAGEFTILFDVVLPLITPGLTVFAVFSFLSNYMGFFWPLVLVKDEAYRTLPLGLTYFDSLYGTQLNLLMAGLTLSLLPLVIGFLLLQRHIVAGLQAGAVKG